VPDGLRSSIGDSFVADKDEARSAAVIADNQGRTTYILEPTKQHCAVGYRVSDPRKERVNLPQHAVPRTAKCGDEVHISPYQSSRLCDTPRRSAAKLLCIPTIRS